MTRLLLALAFGLTAAGVRADDPKPRTAPTAKKSDAPAAKADEAKKDDEPVKIPLRARRSVTNAFKQHALAMHNFHDVYDSFPTGVVGTELKGINVSNKALSWRVRLLPFIEEGPLHRKFKLDEPWDSEHNAKVAADNPMPKLFALAADTGAKATETHFQVFRGEGAVFGEARVRLQTIPDGSSNTIMVTLGKKPVPWTQPDDLDFDPEADPRKLMLLTTGGYFVALCDGSVKTLPPETSAATMKALITAAGAEVIELEKADKADK